LITYVPASKELLMTDIGMFEPLALNRKSVAERVADRLLELIRSGNLQAGDKLPTENELAKAMQVSRPMVREALRGLSILGVVESRQGGRCYVTDLSPARLMAPLQMIISIDETNVDALFEARVAIEGELLRLDAKRITNEDLQKLRDMVRTGHDLTGDAVGFRVMDLEFHQMLMDIAGNPFLARGARSLYELGMEYRRIASETPGVLARSAKEHEAIVDALAQRDPDKAAAAMHAHLKSIARSTIDAIKAVARQSSMVHREA
jgi:GntR family transcriptional regulator, transcriptional repressor for pyruvate dehydrogenase complex